MKMYVVLYGERGFTCDIQGIYTQEEQANLHRDALQAKITSSVDFARVETHQIKFMFKPDNPILK